MNIFDRLNFFAATIFLTLQIFCRISSATVMQERLLLESQLHQDGVILSGRVLIDTDNKDWATVATKKGKLNLQARAHFLDSDVAEIEMRVIGTSSAGAAYEEMAKAVVRLGEPATIMSNQMEGSEDAKPLRIKMKVLRVRYTL